MKQEPRYGNHHFPTQRPEEHQAQEHAVVLVSGAFVPALARLAETFGVTGCVGTHLEVRDARYTGRIIPPVITRQDKNLYTREFLSSRGLEVDWEASYAYTDSIIDVELFSMVGHSVASYPEVKLHPYAYTNRCEMIGTPKV